MTELARRAKAAASYAGIDLKDLATRMGMSESTLYRETRKTRWKPYEKEGFIKRLADATKLRVEFFTEDFAVTAPGEARDVPVDLQPGQDSSQESQDED